ncbi:MAG TPA: tRNA (cytidine(56)-2'-O)-methyltransferase [archaeon]|nr:tRNA (cytidine(56)-2'-O)-methyltransferase [archaeon]
MLRASSAAGGRLTVFRLGHRIFRDQRITTHCGLVARALGARGFAYSGQHDSEVGASLTRAVEQWGGPFAAAYIERDLTYLKQWKRSGGKVAHLTMYGLPFQKALPKLRKAKKLLVVVGGEKVPGEIYRLADWNLSVTSQPHSEVAALAILLWELNSRREPKLRSAKLRIVPQERGKRVVPFKTRR